MVESGPEEEAAKIDATLYCSDKARIDGDSDQVEDVVEYNNLKVLIPWKTTTHPTKMAEVRLEHQEKFLELRFIWAKTKP